MEGIDPRSAQLNWMMGALRLNLGDRNGARGYDRRTIDLQPTSPNAYAGMGDVETVEGRLDEAVRWYVAGLEQDPGQPHMTSWVGYLYLSLGDVERAAVWFERGASLLHGSGPTHEIIAEFVPLVFHNSDAGRLIELVGGASPGLFGPFGSRMFRKAVLTTGKATEIRSYYEELWPELFNENPEIGPFNFDVVPEVVWMIQSETERDHTDAMLEEALAVFRDNQWASMYPSDLATSLPEVEILGLLGREDEALNALHEQIAKGWRFGWWQVSRDPVLESIRDRPGFTDMLEDVRADMASQLAAMPDYDPPPSSE